MAPSSYTSAAIIDGIDKKEFFCEIRHHKTRRLSLPAYLTASVDDKTFAMEQYAPSSPRASYNYVWAPATEMDEDSVERPEDICMLGADWDPEEAGWNTDYFAVYTTLDGLYAKTKLEEAGWSTDYCAAHTTLDGLYAKNERAPSSELYAETESAAAPEFHRLVSWLQDEHTPVPSDSFTWQ
eukprot:CAMPEP_0180235510 /NCGR_PEP_ID=MMETSP0987-20121128/29253_1 /TAXON_ID=697907 /ORGANISM="non described non described, Strain CCMP2293" /LENGTH=181 /DNA_ID=CAMNT_0022201611 /DNA_START=87 /DNA_END=632 /DNA_ORIENTATION=-